MFYSVWRGLEPKATPSPLDSFSLLICWDNLFCCLNHVVPIFSICMSSANISLLFCSSFSFPYKLLKLYVCMNLNNEQSGIRNTRFWHAVEFISWGGWQDFPISTLRVRLTHPNTTLSHGNYYITYQLI